LLLTIFVIVELARVLHAWLAIENGARFGVRYAVTREYDLVYCSAILDSRCEDETEEPFAQVQSIKDAAKSGAVAILRNESSGWNESGYFKVTVCPRDKDPDLDRYEPPDSDIPFDSAGCRDGDDPGEPGDFISVTVDFNHPLITPFLTAVWPQLHLHSRREAIVEQFRTSRVVEPPGGLPTLVPTNTYTVTPTFTLVPTDTPTVTPSPTNTPTITPTPDCSELRITGMWTSGDQVRADVRNGSLSTAYLIDSYLEWPRLDGDMEVDRFEFKGLVYYGGPGLSSPTSSPAPSIPLAGNGTTERWAADFDNEPYRPIWGSYYLELTFEFPGVDTCLLTRSYFRSQPPPPPTNTPRPTNTTGPPAPTRTTGPTNTPRPPTKTPGPPTNTPEATSTSPPATNTLPPPPGD
jgi:hypothetical protein